VFLLCRERDPCSLYLGAMIVGMGIFIECGYGSNVGIVATTLHLSFYIVWIKLFLKFYINWKLHTILK
jgi:hypothetical protein